MARILELGRYIVAAYAGMLLAEQGHAVTKWTDTTGDPILGLTDGRAPWDWLNHGKILEARHPRDVAQVWNQYDLILDNTRPARWAGWSVDPAMSPIPWVAMQADIGERSFDIVAQARAWGGLAPYVPFYLGDTAAGLFLAFKGLACLQAQERGYHPLGHASCLAKLVEGELGLTPSRDGQTTPWDAPGTYVWTPAGAQIVYRGETLTEPVRDDGWRWAHLWHDGTGRIKI